ncbi:uncharacterized protein [Haliotis cracherodii]|uniref:uncharacterized protein n=1 Tax=Haliotis cracherodii TaxID=6455 RepID=UPI0039E9F8F6
MKMAKTISPYDIFVNFVSLITFLLDVGTDILVTVQFFENGDLVWGSLTAGFVGVPTLLIQIFSLKWHISDKSLTVATCLPHLFLFAPVQRYLSVIRLALKAKSTRSFNDIDRVYREQNDVCILRLMESFMEAAPQLCLQLYVIFLANNITILAGVSVCSSLISLAWALTAYGDGLRLAYRDLYRRNWGGLVVHWLWQTFMTAARVMALVMFATVFKAWVFLAAGIHWIAITIWISVKGTDFGDGICERGLFQIVAGFMYIFCFLNLREGRSRYRMLVFYLVFFLENATLVAVWFAYKETSSVLDFVTPSVVFGGFVLGILCLLLYYRLLHPGGPIYLYTIKSTVHNTVLNNQLEPRPGLFDVTAGTLLSVLGSDIVELSRDMDHTTLNFSRVSTRSSGGFSQQHMQRVWEAGLAGRSSSSDSSLDMMDSQTTRSYNNGTLTSSRSANSTRQLLQGSRSSVNDNRGRRYKDQADRRDETNDFNSTVSSRYVPRNRMFTQKDIYGFHEDRFNGTYHSPLKISYESLGMRPVSLSPLDAGKLWEETAGRLRVPLVGREDDTLSTLNASDLLEQSYIHEHSSKWASYSQREASNLDLYSQSAESNLDSYSQREVSNFDSCSQREVSNLDSYSQREVSNFNSCSQREVSNLTSYSQRESSNKSYRQKDLSNVGSYSQRDSLHNVTVHSNSSNSSRQYGRLGRSRSSSRSRSEVSRGHMSPPQTTSNYNAFDHGFLDTSVPDLMDPPECVSNYNNISGSRDSGPMYGHISQASSRMDRSTELYTPSVKGPWRDCSSTPSHISPAMKSRESDSPVYSVGTEDESGVFTNTSNRSEKKSMQYHDISLQNSPEPIYAVPYSTNTSSFHQTQSVPAVSRHKSRTNPGIPGASRLQYGDNEDIPGACNSLVPDTPWRLDYLNLEPLRTALLKVKDMPEPKRHLVREYLKDLNDSITNQPSPLKVQEFQNSPARFGRSVDLFNSRAWQAVEQIVEGDTGQSDKGHSIATLPRSQQRSRKSLLSDESGDAHSRPSSGQYDSGVFYQPFQRSYIDSQNDMKESSPFGTYRHSSKMSSIRGSEASGAPVRGSPMPIKNRSKDRVERRKSREIESLHGKRSDSEKSLNGRYKKRQSEEHKEIGGYKDRSIGHSQSSLNNSKLVHHISPQQVNGDSCVDVLKPQPVRHTQTSSDLSDVCPSLASSYRQAINNSNRVPCNLNLSQDLGQSDLKLVDLQDENLDLQKHVKGDRRSQGLERQPFQPLHNTPAFSPIGEPSRQVRKPLEHNSSTPKLSSSLHSLALIDAYNSPFADSTQSQRSKVTANSRLITDSTQRSRGWVAGPRPMANSKSMDRAKSFDYIR